MEFYALEEVDKAVAAIQEREQRQLLARPNVLGVGVGRKSVAGFETSEPCLVVLVSRKLPNAELPLEARVPSLVEHCKTDVLEVGAVEANEPPLTLSHEPNSLAQRVRPAQGGFSVGGREQGVGSIAVGVLDAELSSACPSRYYLLGSNSALAGLNTAQLGDPVLQPSTVDGGKFPDDVLGRLTRFVPIHFDETPNSVDAAIAETSFSKLDRSVYWIGHSLGRAARVRIGQVLQKTGRASCYTAGLVRAVNVTIVVNYGVRRAHFYHQILTSRCATVGDSGSLVLDTARHAVGLNLAASPSFSVVSPIGLVESALGIRVGW